jgi:eukaryotic-like serine/threonine-protein kinase
MALSVGTRLGPYEIVALLGTGGMGEVYRAHDPRLGRDVAIKVLPAAFSADPDRLRRFEQEARAAAALNHPNILAVYDLGTHDGAPYVVSELLEGTTLREALANGAFPVRKVVDYATQIANGLATAHERGIIHRDLKPENLFITSDGRAKILDFGLAKLIETVPVGAGATMAATRTAGTTPGIVLGTIGYMSPEQVRGQVVDHRSDIFSFGAILYEMLSGERAFKGGTPADTMSAILNNEPRELTAISGGVVSPALERIARHCLEKEPSRRFQSTRDLAFDLETVSGISGPIASDHHPALSWRRRWQMPVTAGLVGLACGGLAAWLIGRSLTRTAADTPVVEHVARITHESGFSQWPTWSPDGSLFAFSSNRNGNFELYVGRVAGGQEVVNVTNNPADDVQPAFSPDGAAIAFVSTRSSRTGLVKIGTFIGFDTRTYGGDVWVTPALGGQARRMAENGNFPVWHPNSRTVLYVTGQENHRAIFAVSIDGGSPNPVLPSTASTWEIVRLAYSPDARWITFETADRQLFAMPAAGGRPTELLRGSSHVWDPTGPRIYYFNQEAAGGTRIEAAEVQQTAAAPTVARVWVVGVSTGSLHDLAIATDGKHLLASGIEESLNLTRVLLEPGGGDVAGPEEELSSGQVRDRYPAISPDGRRIALSSNRIGDEGLWIVDLPSARWQRVQMPTNKGDWVTQACWAHDGQHLAVTRFSRNGTVALWYVAIDGSSTEQLLPPTPNITGNFACAFSPDSRLLYAHLAGGFSQLFILDVASRREQQLTRSPSDKYDGVWSPDGRWVTFAANTDGTVQVWRIPAGGGQEQRLTTGFERMRHPFYSPDGRWLYVQPSHRNIYRMPADGGPPQQVTRLPESGLFIEEPTISPDGRYLVYNRGHGGSSLWMLTLGASSSR